MSELETQEQRAAFLGALYSGRHVVRIQEATGWEDWLRMYGLPALLPLRTGMGGADDQLSIFFIAADASAFRRLSDQFRAFIGLTHTDTRTVRRIRASAKTRYITDHCGEDCFFARVRVNRDKEPQVFEALRRWLTVLKKERENYRPLVDTKRPTPEERIRYFLNAFQQSLAALDRGAARAALREIEDKALLDTVNRHFLRIQFHAAFGEWDAIDSNTDFHDLIQLRRPAAVTEAMIKAAYMTQLAAFDDSVDSLFDKFRSIYPRYQLLFKGRGTLRSREVVRSFMLRAVALEQDTDEALCNELLALPDLVPSEVEYLECLAMHGGLLERGERATTMDYKATVVPQIENTADPSHRLEPTYTSQVPARLVKDAVAAFQSGHDDAGIRLLTGAPASTEKATLLLRYARREDTLCARSVAISGLNELPLRERQRLLQMPTVQAEAQRLLSWLFPAPKKAPPKAFPAPNTLRPEPKRASAVPTVTDTHRDASQSLEQHPAPAQMPVTPVTPENLPRSIPTDWSKWLEAANAGSLTREFLYDCAAAGVSEWSVVGLARNPETVLSFVAELDRVWESGNRTVMEIVTDALPLLLQAFIREPEYPRPAFSPVYKSLRCSVTYYLTERGYTNTVLTLFYDLVVAQMASGVSTSEYGEMLDEMDLYWDKCSAANARLLLDQLDALQEFPVINEPQRSAIARVAFGKVGDWLRAGRLDLEVERYARRLAAEYRADGFLPTASPDLVSEASTARSTDNPLAGRVIALYTLMESAGNRLKSLITNRYPGCEVRVNAEKDGSVALKTLAERAHIFIMVTGCAKHAATEFIERHRGKQKPILRPSGRGSSSVLTVLSEYLDVGAARP